MIRFRQVAGRRPTLQPQGPQGLLGPRFVLRGDVVPMTASADVLRGGRVCVDGARIAAVLAAGEGLPEEFAGAPEVDTGGTLYPGLIDLHNHLAYNHVPLWQVDKPYTNRNTWRLAEPEYPRNVTVPYRVLSDNADTDYRRAIVRWAECRNLLGGATTGQGLSLTGPAGMAAHFRGLMRNVEQPLDGEGPACGGRTLDYRPHEIEPLLVPALAEGRPFFYHLSEGTDAAARQCFLDLKRSNGRWAVASNLIAIHGVALRPADFEVLEEAAGLVWSPTSNLLLYGQTADVAAAKARGIPIALGADWAPSGCKNLLGELKVARAVSRQLGNLFTPRELVEAVTRVPARMIGWQHEIGSLQAGRRADLLVLRGTASDPYTHLIEADEAQLAAVLIDGRPRLAATELALGDAASCEALSLGGRPYLLDLTERQDNGLGGMRLATATAKLAFGLERLPELAAALQSDRQAFVDADADVYRLVDEFGSEDAASVLDFEALALPTRPLELEPITAVDDAGLAQRMARSPNLPEYVKAVF